MSAPVWLWITLGGVVGGLLMIDVLVVHRTPSVVTLRRATLESAVWIAISLAFGTLVWASLGAAAGGEYYSAYLTEKALSVDNVFVWAVILAHFRVPREFQHRVLFWGVMVALVLRFGFISLGVTLLGRLEWLFYVFGAVLLVTAWRLVSSSETDVDPDAGRMLRLARRVVPSVPEFNGQHFLVRHEGRLVATTLFFVLVAIETTDLVFAVDSLPAVLALTQDRFVALSSNAFAVLGLRALYFMFADLHDRFRYLEPGLAIILAFVGLKMILEAGIGSLTLHISTPISLGVIVVVLGGAITASMSEARSTAAPSR